MRGIFRIRQATKSVNLSRAVACAQRRTKLVGATGDARIASVKCAEFWAVTAPISPEHLRQQEQPQIRPSLLPWTPYGSNCFPRLREAQRESPWQRPKAWRGAGSWLPAPSGRVARTKRRLSRPTKRAKRRRSKRRGSRVLRPNRWRLAIRSPGRWREGRGQRAARRGASQQAERWRRKGKSEAAKGAD